MGLFNGQVRGHPFRRVIADRAVNLVVSRLEIDVQNLGVIGRDVGKEFFLNAFPFDLKVMLFLPGVANQERRFSSAECFRHVNVMLGQLYFHLPRVFVRSDCIDDFIDRPFRGVRHGAARLLGFFLRLFKRFGSFLPERFLLFCRSQ